jgi:hypothetical protein
VDGCTTVETLDDSAPAGHGHESSVAARQLVAFGGYAIRIPWGPSRPASGYSRWNAPERARLCVVVAWRGARTPPTWAQLRRRYRWRWDRLLGRQPQGRNLTLVECGTDAEKAEG